MQDAVYIQECVPEKLELKKSVWTKIDNLVTDNNTIMASSTSCIVPSKISEEFEHRDQFIVAHPVCSRIAQHVRQSLNVLFR